MSSIPEEVSSHLISATVYVHNAYQLYLAKLEHEVSRFLAQILCLVALVNCVWFKLKIFQRIFRQNDFQIHIDRSNDLNTASQVFNILNS